MLNDKLKTKIDKLKLNDKKELIDCIRNSYSIFNEYAKVTKCPHYNSIHIVKNGTRNDITRYLYKSLTYKSTTIERSIY